MANNREERKQIFEDLVLNFKESGLENGEFDKPGILVNLGCEKYQQINNKSSIANKIEWHNTNTAHFMLEMNHDSKPLIFIFGSAYKPGGGVVSGSKAQEEDIALHSSWYFQARHNDDFFKMDHKDYIYSDYAVYTEKSLLMTDKYNQPLTEYKTISLITAAAPNLSAYKTNKIQIDSQKVYHAYEKRVRGLLNFAEQKGHKELVLGPWGCGVFGLSPTITANIFKRCLEENLYTGTVIFSILDINMFNEYKDIIEPDTLKYQTVKKISL